jgi:outer membrane protein
MKKITASICAAIMVFSTLVCFSPDLANAKELKVGFVDLRKAFYDYEKAKTMDADLNEFAEATQQKRDTMVQDVTKLRDEIELMDGETRERKQKEMEAKIRELQEFDRDSRQIILERKDNLFREVMDDIQKVVTEKGTSEGYDYVLDSRNIMYADDKYDLTEEVVAELNK